MKSSILLSAAATLAVVAAQSKGGNKGGDNEALYYTQPVEGTKWKAGQNYTVSWLNNCSDKNDKSLEVVLYRATGANSTSMVRVPGVAALGTVDCTKDKSVTVSLPATVAPGPWYAVYVATQPDESYSAQFEILSENPVSTTTTPVSSTTTLASTSTTTASATVSANTTTSAGATGTPSPNPANAAGSLKALGAATMAFAAGAAALLF